MARKHFERLGVRLEYEPVFGAKRPEFGILNANDEIEAVFEVKSITQPAFTEDMVRIDDASKRFGKQIEKAREQARAAKSHPFLLMIDTRGTMMCPDESLICGGMFGTSVVEFTLYTDGSTTSMPTRAKDGKMRQPHWSTPQNTTISAVGTLALRVLSCPVAVEGEVDSTMLPDWVRAAAAQADATSGVGTFGGHRLFMCHFEYMKLVLNRDARLPWPDHLIGPWDEVYECDMPPRCVRKGRLLGIVPDGFVE